MSTPAPAPAKPWHRQPDEPAAAFARFCHYLSIGPGRTLANAYALHVAQTHADTSVAPDPAPCEPPSVDAAAQAPGASEGTERHQPSSVPGNWRRDSVRWQWVERSRAYDAEMLAQHGADVVVLLIHSLRQLALKTADALADPKLKPTGWLQVLAALNCLGAHVPPESVARVTANQPTPSANHS